MYLDLAGFELTVDDLYQNPWGILDVSAHELRRLFGTVFFMVWPGNLLITRRRRLLHTINDVLSLAQSSVSTHIRSRTTLSSQYMY